MAIISAGRPSTRKPAKKAKPDNRAKAVAAHDKFLSEPKPRGRRLTKGRRLRR